MTDITFVRRSLVLGIILLSFIAGVIYALRNTHSIPGAGIAKLAKRKNEVQMRRAESLSWDEAQLGVNFKYYDSVLTMTDSTATLEFKDGTALEIEPDSLIVLEPPTQKDSEFHLLLKKGKATFKIKKGGTVEVQNKVIRAKEDMIIEVHDPLQVAKATPSPIPTPTLSAKSSEVAIFHRPPEKKEVSAKIKNILHLKVIREN